MNFSNRTLLVTLVGLAFPFALFAGTRCWLDGETEVSRLSLPDGSELRFTVDNFHDEGGRPILWQRFVDSKAQHHRHAIGYCYPNLVFDAEFQVATTKDGDLVVVVERRNTDVILGFIEFSTAIQYPGNGQPPWEEYYARMNSVIDKIRNENPEVPYVLSDQVPGCRDLFVR